MQKSASQITVYTRVSCDFCTVLLSDLDAAGVPYVEVSLSHDREAEARVAELNDGAAIAPTVVVGELVLTNPTLGDVVEAASRL